MNAGAYDGEMKQVVESVRLITPDGNIVTKSCEEMKFSYRHSILKEEAYLVFYFANVYGGLASYGGIGHCQQGGGDINISYSTMVGSSHKATHIAHHTATKVYYYAVAVDAHFEQSLP